MGRHKGSGEGSIFKTGKGWRGQISIDGERKSVSGKTKKEVVDKLAKLRTDFNEGNYVKRNDVTVQEWCEFWLNTRKKPTLAEQSFLRLEALFRNHIYMLILENKNTRSNESRPRAKLRESVSVQKQKYKLLSERLFSQYRQCAQRPNEEMSTICCRQWYTC